MRDGPQYLHELSSMTRKAIKIVSKKVDYYLKCCFVPYLRQVCKPREWAAAKCKAINYELGTKLSLTAR